MTMRDCPSIHGPKEGPLLGANGFEKAQNRSSRVAARFWAVYRGSVSNFAVALARWRCASSLSDPLPKATMIVLDLRFGSEARKCGE